MIETVFSKSAYGSLKLAQNCGADKHSSASIGLVLSGRTNISPEELETLKADAELQAHRKWETSIPLGGNPADVYCIDVAWSMGDISDDEIGNNRKSVLEQAFFWNGVIEEKGLIERRADRRKARLIHRAAILRRQLHVFVVAAYACGGDIREGSFHCKNLHS